MNIKLNNRLNSVASLICCNRSIIDVGCDHALLDIYLVLNKEPKKVIASDIKEGPLKSAYNNIKKYGLSDKIILRLGNGIETIDNDINTIVISGMGGLNMIGILKYNQNKYKQVDTIILSPNSDTYQVRKQICKFGFYIDDEVLVKDNKIIYPVIRFKRGRKRYSYNEYLCGPYLIKKHDNLFVEYMSRERDAKEKLLEVLPKKYFEKRYALKKELKAINKVL
mgnify:FL=1